LASVFKQTSAHQMPDVTCKDGATSSAQVFTQKKNSVRTQLLYILYKHQLVLFGSSLSELIFSKIFSQFPSQSICFVSCLSCFSFHRNLLQHNQPYIPSGHVNLVVHKTKLRTQVLLT